MLTAPLHATPPAACDPYDQHDPIPVAYATEHVNDTVWHLWEDLQQQDQRQFADTAPLTLPGPLSDSGDAPPVAMPHGAASANRLTVESVMAEARRNARVCPRPEPWLRLYMALPGKEALNDGEKLSPPLNAKAMAGLPSLPKRLCLLEHVEWAAARGCLEQVYLYLKGLPETDWHHLGD
jgi:hypothetical protein